MKIHDKFVIELSEVIKGYGNDYRDEDPCHMPCDYKFYEINGVSICEESFKKMKRLEDEINDVLDKIRAEIEQEYNCLSATRADETLELGECLGLKRALKIIGKYKEKQGGE